MSFRCHINRLALAFFTLCLASATDAGLFVPGPEPWPMWAPADETSTATIDHGVWQGLLDTYLLVDSPDGIHRFTYGAVSGPDRRRLQGYIAGLAGLDPRDYARAEQMAYWVNLYNALTIEAVLAEYPVKSIREVYGGLLNTGPWNRTLVTVAGQPLSLNDIEHRILRPLWRDPRIHYAVNCASLGCPNLAARAYTGENLEQLLDAGERTYINHPRGVSLGDGRLTLSSIFDWYDTDFGADPAARRAYLERHAEPALAARLAAYQGRARYAYDWRLNDVE